MSNATRFPLNHGFHSGLSDQEVKINGMKVLFDEKVDLMPVKLTPKASVENRS